MSERNNVYLNIPNSNSSRCPCCGYCPHCGRANPNPWQQPTTFPGQPGTFPFQQPTVTCGDTTLHTTSVQSALESVYGTNVKSLQTEEASRAKQKYGVMAAPMSAQDTNW